MQIRRLGILVVVMLLVSTLWAKERLTPEQAQRLVAKSDALYYTPLAHDLHDLAVDITVEQLSKDPIGKDAQITYYYAGTNHERVAISNIPDQYASFRDRVMNLVTPYSQFILPRPASATFTGMTLGGAEVTRALAGVKSMSFYMVVGKATPPKDGVKEYRVLLDKHGIFYQIENVLSDNTTVIASVESVQTRAGWHVVTITTRLLTKDGNRWKIEHLEYDVVDGYTVPVSLTVQNRDEANRPIKGMDDIAVRFTNYRINTGVATATLATLEKSEAAGNATPPEK